MDGADNLNQPDLPNEEKGNPSFESKDIRHSFAGSTKSIFVDSVTETKRSPKVTMLLVVVASVLVVSIITLIVLSSLSSRGSGPASSSENSSSQSSDTPNSAEDAKLRSNEEEKLSTVVALVAQEDWEHASALLETISPRNLSECSKLYYYRSVINISAHIKNENLPIEAATVNVERLKDACLVVNE